MSTFVQACFAGAIMAGILFAALQGGVYHLIG